MPYEYRGPRNWEIPLGPVGLGAMAIVGGAAFTVGEFNFWGLQFLTYWQVLAGSAASLAGGAAFGTLLQCLVWNGMLGRGGRFLSTWSSTQRAILAASVLVLFSLAHRLALALYPCLLVSAPLLQLLAFAIAVRLQEPILFALRDAGRPGAALAALLLLEAAILFPTGEWLAASAYRKGLTRFQNEHQLYWPLSSTGNTDFYFDYGRREVVLRTHALNGDPIEVSRSFAGFACR